MNLMMYGASAPQYDDVDESAGWNPKLDANDPNNFTDKNDNKVRDL
jgi:hypothetical protein